VHVDWQTVGAIAGPVLALASLAWQASERLRRPLIDTTIDAQTVNTRVHEDRHGADAYEDVAWVGATARVVNPRSSMIVIAGAELRARWPDRRWRAPWRRSEVLAADRMLLQVAAGSEETVRLSQSIFHEPRDLRVIVRLRHGRRLRGPWHRDAGKDAIEYAREENERERRPPRVQPPPWHKP
jgi:hypothetical protein